MKFYEFLLFILVDIIIHILVVKWEVKTNKDLFVDIELRPLFKLKKED